MDAKGLKGNRKSRWHGGMGKGKGKGKGKAAWVPRRSLRVEVSTLSGRLVIYDMKLPGQLSILKEKIAQDFSTPPPFQILCAGSVCLEDHADLASYCTDDVGRLRVTMVTSINKYIASNFPPNIGSKTKKKRLRVLVDLLVASSLDSMVGQALCETDCLNDIASREFVLKLLLEKVANGERDVTAALSDLLWNREGMQADVVQQAVLALGTLADEDGPGAISVVSHLLEDQNQSVRLAAMVVVGKFVLKGNETLLHVLTNLNLLEDAIPETKVAALRTLCMLVESAGEATIAAKHKEIIMTAVIGCLEDDDDRVRLVATEALAKTANLGKEEAIAATITRLEDELCEVRLAALDVLAEITQKEDQGTVTAMVGCTQDCKARVRKAAIQTLVKLVDRILLGEGDCSEGTCGLSTKRESSGHRRATGQLGGSYAFALVVSSGQNPGL